MCRCLHQSPDGASCRSSVTRWLLMYSHVAVVITEVSNVYIPMFSFSPQLLLSSVTRWRLIYPHVDVVIEHTSLRCLYTMVGSPYEILSALSKTTRSDLHTGVVGVGHFFILASRLHRTLSNPAVDRVLR